MILALSTTTCGEVTALACSTRDAWATPILDVRVAIPAGRYYLRVDHDTAYGTSAPSDFELTVELLAR